MKPFTPKQKFAIIAPFILFYFVAAALSDWLRTKHLESVPPVLGLLAFVGFITSVLVVSGVTISGIKKDLQELAARFFKGVGCIVGAILFIAIALLCLWGIVALIKFFWVHS
jgi:hypothetical protein